MADLLSVSSYTNPYREAREAKRGGTAPGESRSHKPPAFELNKIYAVNPRIQKINIASPNIKNGSSTAIQAEAIAGGGTKTKDKPRIKFSQGLGLNRNEPIKYIYNRNV
jgi:hypothetical protein